MDNKKSNGVNSIKKFLTRVKLPKETFELIAKQMLSTFKLDKFTKKAINEHVIKAGKYSYIGLIKKYNNFLTPIRLMILVDYVNILKAMKYYLNDELSDKYDKKIAKDYNLIAGLQASELKLIMLEQLFELFGESAELGIIFHEPYEKIDAMVQINEKIKINMTNNEGSSYILTLNNGKYVFESRSCCSITETSYILNNNSRQKYIKSFDKYFLFVPKDTTVYDDIVYELEKNNIKIIYSDYGTINIVNDVLYMEGILKKEQILDRFE